MSSLPAFLADDLSGALEAGAAFRRLGWRVTVSWRLPDGGSDEGSGTVMGWSTDTRNRTPADAAGRVARVLEAGGDSFRWFYKKIDSTLRGPVAAELAVIRGFFPNRPIVVCPANPGAGRTVTGGELRVDGVPVAATAFGHDPLAPVGSSRVVDHLRHPDIGAAEIVGLRQIQGDAGLAGFLAGRFQSGVVIVSDAETDEDLGRLVHAARTANPEVIFMGSGALAPLLLAAQPVSAGEADAGSTPDSEGSVLLVFGSHHPASRGHQAEATREDGVECVEIGDPVSTAAAAIAAIRAGRRVALTTPDAPHAEAAGLFSIRLAEAAARIVSQAPISRLFVTGGETAREVFAGLGGTSVDVDGELIPGWAHGRLRMPEGAELRILTKPGGFGPARWPEEARRWMQES